MREIDWVFALATFLELRGDKPDEALKYLDDELHEPLHKVLAYLKSKPDLISRIAHTE